MTRSRSNLALCAFFIAIIGIWFSFPSAGVPVLAYHQVNDEPEIYSIHPAEFEEQMRFLAGHGYTAISLAEMVAAWEGRGALPDKPIIITFDDGYADNYLTALPIMEKYQMKATVFVIAGDVGKPTYLTWEQIRAMQSRGTEIGSHTLSHVALGDKTANEQRTELQQSKELLEQQLGQPIRFLAYPYGSFNAMAIDMLRQTGYQGACTGITGLNHNSDNPYTWKRINVPQPKGGMWEFRLRLWRAEWYGKWAVLFSKSS